MKLRKWIDFFTEQSLNLLVFLPPLVFLPLWRDWYDISKFFSSSFLTGFVIFLIGLNFVRKPKKIKPNETLLLLYFSFWAIFLLSSLLSVHPLTSFLGGEYMYTHTFFHITSLLLLSFSLYLWFQLKKKEQIVSNLAIYISSSAFLVSAFGLFQLFQHPNTVFTTYRVRSSIGEPNRLAFYLIASLPISMAFIFKKEIYRKILGIISTITSTVIIIFTFSRGAWIALALSFIFFSLTQKQRIAKFLRQFRLNFVSILFLCLFAFLVASPVGRRVSERIVAIKNDLVTQSGSTYLRFSSLQSALNLFNDQPFFRKLVGIGPDTAAFFLLKHKDQSLNLKRSPNERIWRTYLIRNQYLHTLINSGILGFLVLVFLISFTIKQFLFQKKHSGVELGFYGSFLIIIFSGLFYYESVLTSLIFWISLPVLWNMRPISQREQISRNWVKLLSFICIFGGIFIFSYAALYAIADNFAFRKDYQTATKLLPFYDTYWRDWADTYSTKAYKTKSEKDIKKAINLSRKALNLNPMEVENLASVQLAYYRAGVFLDKSYHQTALTMGKKRVLLDSARAEVFDDLGLAYLDLGQLDQALVNFKQAITIDPDSRGSYLHIGEVYKQKGDLDRAIEYYQMAIDKFPNYHLAQTELEKARSLKTKK